ncbi:hypothetical protein V8C35DRAFT_132466 [Trichoderma chlorosporum]
MEANVILFDNPSRFGTGTCWSPNVWKVRLLLNFKNINYETQWVHGPDIKPTLEKLGLRPHEKLEDEVAEYTLPAIRLPDGSYVMDSLPIAHALQSLFPQPNAHLDSAILSTVIIERRKLISALNPVLVPRMPRVCLSGTTIEYHRQARKKTFGMSLEELESRYGGEVAWSAATPSLKRLADVLNSNSSGPFFLGDEASYADFVIVGFFEWCRCVGDDVFERILSVDPALGLLYSSCEVWLKRNN